MQLQKYTKPWTLIFCLLGIHKWKEYSTFVGENVPNTMKRCLRCGKEKCLKYSYKEVK